jgi:hypothetical protein
VVIIGDCGFTLLVSTGLVTVDPDLLFSGALVSLDDADGAKEVGNVIFCEITWKTRNVNLILTLDFLTCRSFNKGEMHHLRKITSFERAGHQCQE